MSGLHPASDVLYPELSAQHVELLAQRLIEIVLVDHAALYGGRDDGASAGEGARAAPALAITAEQVSAFRSL